MAPVLFGVRLYPLVVALAALAGVVASAVSARRLRRPVARLFAIEAVLVAAAFAGAKLFWLCEMDALTTPWRVPFTVDGLRYPGGVLALLLLLPYVAARGGISLVVLGDLLAPAAAVAMSVVRVGCLLQGCCFGPVSSLPWAIAFPLRSKAWLAHVESGLIARTELHSLPVQPLQIYFGLWSLAVALLLFHLQGRRHRPGAVALLFLILHEGGKAALESLRVPRVPALQIVSASVAVGAAIVWLVRERQSATGVTPAAAAAPPR